MTPGDHGAIKLLLDAKVSAAVNGMLLQRARAVGTKAGSSHFWQVPPITMYLIPIRLCPPGPPPLWISRPSYSPDCLEVPGDIIYCHARDISPLLKFEFKVLRPKIKVCYAQKL